MRANRYLSRAARLRQTHALREYEAHLRALAREGRREEFFMSLAPLLPGLYGYIQRRLRIEHLRGVPKGLYTEEDLMEELLTQAFERLDTKPEDVALEPWLYFISNEVLR